MVIRIRPARSSDDQGIEAMARALSRESLRRRFLAGIARDVAAGELRDEAHRAGDVALIAEAADGTIVGEAYAALLGGKAAEAAFVVADPYQHQGLGTRLFAAVVRELQRRGVESLQIETLAQNREMLGLVEESGLPHAGSRTGGTVQIALRLPAGRGAAQPGP